MDFLPAVQVAALGGTPAVVFIVSLFGAAVAIAVARGARIGRPAVTYGLALVVLIGAGGYGARRLLRPAVTETVSVALIASDRYPGPKTPWPAAWAEYAPAIDTAAGKGARLVVLPEEIARLSSAEFPAAAASAAEAADRNRVGLLIGLRMVDGRKTFNRAIGFGPSGQTAVYAKQQLVPGFEAMITPGHADKVLPGDPPRTGIAICRDMDYPALARRYAALGAGLMLVPAWDFGRDGWQHSRMAILRGVEDGFTLVRSARGGLMTVSDRYGRVLAQAPSAPHTATLMAAAPLDGRGPAFYARAGDLFGWACVFGAAAFILSAMRRPRPVAPPLA